ncbi:uncharacterized protein LOC119723352 [Patiria miniata]|uniref:Paraneoplastic antigen Ma-like C-terminal domain-containing protein n=1 Tax=Patiria miniata TaxID=46514 RepID=A0A913ZEH7_PATMI|nr:uncharacterized protein LOC119723352 [Patiria miniata]
MHANRLLVLLVFVIIFVRVLTFSPHNQQRSVYNSFMMATGGKSPKSVGKPETKLSEGEMMDQIKKLQEQLHATTSEPKAKTSPAFLLMPSQKKLATYSGLPETTLKLEDWICDVKATIRSRSLAEVDKVDFVFQHLIGPAREEVKFRPKKKVEDVFRILREVFGDQGSSVHLQRAFFERRQKEGENIRDFSHALLDLFDRACRKSPHLSVHKEQVLCDQFADGVSDSLLRKHLRKRVKDTPSVEFYTLRSEAIDWAEDPTDISTTKQQVSIQAARTSLASETLALTDIVHKQQQQIQQQQKQIEDVTHLLQEHIRIQGTNKTLESNPTRNLESRPSRSDKGRTRIKCDFCNGVGHSRDRCYKLQLKEAQATIEKLKKEASEKSSSEN